MTPLLPDAERNVLLTGVAVSDVAQRAVKMETLRHRSDFLRAASARRQATASFLLQARCRAEDDGDGTLIRIGYTCSKKIGNAVTRNRAKRRLRALAQEIMPVAARPGWDYVLVGRPRATIDRDFEALRQDLRMALSRIHETRKRETERPVR